MGADVAIWILALPAVVVFFFTYGVIEDMLKKAHQSKHPFDEPKRIHPSPPVGIQAIPEPPPQIRGYDSAELFREDTLIRLQALYRQVAQHEQNIHTILAEIRERERRD